MNTTGVTASPGGRLLKFRVTEGGPVHTKDRALTPPLSFPSSVELDFKQQEDKLQPVLRKLHAFEETQVAPLPYSQETSSSTPKQKSKTEPKKHGRWRLWFL